MSSKGRITVGIARIDCGPNEPTFEAHGRPGVLWHYALPQPISLAGASGVLEKIGFAYQANSPTDQWGMVPYWTPALVFAVLPLLGFRERVRAKSRRQRDCCAFCGYLLTGNMSGVCPECGTKVLERQTVPL